MLLFRIIKASVVIVDQGIWNGIQDVLDFGLTKPTNFLPQDEHHRWGFDLRIFEKNFELYSNEGKYFQSHNGNYQKLY